MYHDTRVDFEKVKCFTDHMFLVSLMMSKKVGISSSGACLPHSTLLDYDLVSDMQGCCIREMDYEISIQVEDSEPSTLYGEFADVPLISFKWYESAKVQSLVETDIVTIQMGNK
jgi:hypothetical protein